MFFVLYGTGRIYFSPLNTLSSRWHITIPEGTKVEEYYSSDHGFHGDGYRIIALSCESDKARGSIFDLGSTNCSPKSVHGNDLRVINRVCSKVLSTQAIKGNILTSDHALLVKSLNQFNNTLIITYNAEDNLYYLFEELI